MGDQGQHPKDKLTAATVKRLRAGKYADGQGLYLQVDADGWRRYFWRGTVHGRRREIAIGPIELHDLKEARETARRWRRIAREGGDPMADRDKHKRQSLTFEQAARKVYADQIQGVARNEKHAAQWFKTLRDYAFPSMGRMPVHAIAQSDVLRALAPIWLEKPETARRVRQRIRTVFAWASTAGYREAANPVDDIEKGLPKQREKVRHFPALPFAEVPPLMQRLKKMDGCGALALRFVILTAARSGEVRGATWGEIDLDAATWTIPAARMKAGDEHRVPLTAEAVSILETVAAMAGIAISRRGAGHDRLIFEGQKRGRKLSDMTLSAALKRAGVMPDHGTVHGMRSTFRDWAGEATSCPREVIERALAHRVENKVEAAYARSTLFEKRKALMEQWARAALHAAGKGDAGGG